MAGWSQIKPNPSGKPEGSENFFGAEVENRLKLRRLPHNINTIEYTHNGEAPLTHPEVRLGSVRARKLHLLHLHFLHLSEGFTQLPTNDVSFE